jgi:hypothetical protein
MFVNGLSFDGTRFRPGYVLQRRGILRRTHPAPVSQTVDLQGMYVVPPFGEAHNLNVEGEWNIDEVIRRYLRDGVFYVKIPGQIPEFSNRIKDRLNRPDSIDVTFSNRGFTASGGHPTVLYRDILREHRYRPFVGALPPQWFAAAIRVTRALISALTGGRPTAERPENLIQCSQKRRRCQRRTVSGVTIRSGCLHSDQPLASQTQ